MKRIISEIRHSLVVKLILIMGCVCLMAIATWAFFNIRYQRNKSLDDSTAIADRIGKTIRLGTHYAMMLNSRDDINQIIKNTASQKGIENMRITNKKGEIKFSNIPAEVERTEPITSWTCSACHQADPPLVQLSLTQRRRLFTNDAGERLLGIITPIYNEPGCSATCHFHNSEDKVLGALDVVLSLKETDAEIIKYEQSIFLLAVAIIIVPSLCIFIFVYKYVIRPIRQLTEETRHITDTSKHPPIKTDPLSEIGRLATAFHSMGQRIYENRMELTKQKNEYQNLFENVPCLITVQDRNFKLINFNREFYTKYNPSPGDYCYQAYKGRNSKCENCPVEKTFIDGRSHYSEELGKGRDGTMEHWIVRTSPVRDARGNIVAAMEINLDITQRKLLEQRAEASEKKYHAIFNNIPNPVFVLDYETLKILDCNESVKKVYNWDEADLKEQPFTRLFADVEKPWEETSPAPLEKTIRSSRTLNKVMHQKKCGTPFPVDIWISLSEYPGRRVLLVTTSDITERLDAETRFNQAAKLATLGEMATGVAHELNQPLSVIKTASSFCRSKIEKDESIQPDILQRLLLKIDDNVDRASRIITHMRDFSRKSDVNHERVDVNAVLVRACEIFSQQLKVRGIHVSWDLAERLPPVMADPGRLEQVFINLLINARDAIEEKAEKQLPDARHAGEIHIRSYTQEQDLLIEIRDTGAGIPTPVAEKIFQPFFTTKEVGKGTGLGLSISYGIIKESKGQIKIKETSPDGTLFQISLPVETVNA